MKSLQKIVVGMTMTDSDSHLLGYAALLHATGISTSFDFVHVQLSQQSAKPAEDQEKLRLQMQARVTEHFKVGPDPINPQFHVLEGSREDRLAEYTERTGAGLILLGHRRNRRGKRSLARRLAMIAPASVWMVPEDAPVRIGKVLAPIDFSSHSADSLSIACGISGKANLQECDALHVFFDESTIRFDDSTEHLRGKEQTAFEQFVRPIETHNVKVTPLFEESSNVTHAVLRVAEQRQSDLIVMSTRGRSTAAAILLGSETSQTMVESKVPVLAVKHRGAHLNLLQVLTNRELWTKPSPHTN